MSNLFRRGLPVGCTVKQHQRIGVHAGINARAGQLWRNDPLSGPTTRASTQLAELSREAFQIRYGDRRVRVRRFHSRWLHNRLSHMETGQ